MWDYRCLEAFLAVVNTRSISKAAEMLYVSQSSVSKWINQLETELGVQLIIRHRGRRQVDVTANGRDLVPLAEEWVNINQKITTIKGQLYPSVRAMVIDTLNSTVMPEMYKELLNRIPDLRLSIYTGQSADIYNMVENGVCDIGITSLEMHYPNLTITPFLTEPFRAVIYTQAEMDFNMPIDPVNLDIRKNLYVPSGFVYRQWHEYWFGHAQSYMWVDPVSTAERLFCSEGIWAVVPNCIAANLLQHPNVHELKLTSMPPNRTTHLIMHRYPREQFRIIQNQVRDTLNELMLRRYNSTIEVKNL